MALTCVFEPGLCVAQAAAEAGARAGTVARQEAASVADRTAQLAGTSGGVFSGFGDTLVDLVHEGAAPVESTASATRYAAVAATIITVVLVLLALVVIFKVL